MNELFKYLDGLIKNSKSLVTEQEESINIRKIISLTQDGWKIQKIEKKEKNSNRILVVLADDNKKEIFELGLREQKQLLDFFEKEKNKKRDICI